MRIRQGNDFIFLWAIERKTPQENFRPTARIFSLKRGVT